MRSGAFVRNAAALTLLLGLALAARTIVVRAENPDDVRKLRETGSCKACDLSNANLAGVNAHGGSLTNANLSHSSLYKATLRGADLTGANLDGAQLTGADLTHAKGAALGKALTDQTTVCPSGAHGPCN